MTTALIVAGAVLAFVIVNLLVLRVVLKRLSAKATAALEQETGGRLAARQETVRGMGTASLGKTQVRGNGTLALYDDELVFVQWVPRRVTRIPRRAITAIDTPRAFLGKTVGSRLVSVSWRTDEGAQDQIAWQVRDRDAWLTALGRPPGIPG